MDEFEVDWDGVCDDVYVDVRYIGVLVDFVNVFYYVVFYDDEIVGEVYD